MCRFGFSSSTSLSPLMDAAVTSQGPSAEITTVFGPSQFSLATTPLMFSIISVTSSFTPGMVENSCSTPSILTALTATPGRLESSTLRRELPRVVPKPRSRGSTTNLP